MIDQARTGGQHPNLLLRPGRTGIYIVPATWQVPRGPEARNLAAQARAHSVRCRMCSTTPRGPLGDQRFVIGCRWAGYLNDAYIRTAARGELTAAGWVL